MVKSKKSAKISNLKLKILSNLLLGVLVLSVGALCLAPDNKEVVADGQSTELYRNAKPNGEGVSLLFNVYWGTEEVYRILDTLKKYDAKATFFIGGCWADDNVQCLRDIYAEGHELGNHGYFHKSHDKLTLAQNQKEMEDCNRFIELSVGEKPILFAPPSGAYNENTLSSAKALNMKTILWTRDTIDWRDKNAALIYSRATKSVQKGDFILMHPMKETADALEDILKYYANHSLKVVSVSRNLQSEG